MNKKEDIQQYLRIKSDIVDKSESENFYVWTHRSPNADLYPDLVFFKCQVLSVNGDSYRLKEVIPETGSVYELKKASIFNCNQNVNVESHRLNDLIHQNVPEVLNTLAVRYEHNYIYTIAEPMLISINPYQIIDVDINEYKQAQNPNLAPHVYMYARDALYDYLNTKNNQSIIISGESGSGKTEASKLVIKYYLSEVSKVNDISTTIWDSNIILEAFGNAKTIKNNNSSRYGKYIKIQIDDHKNIVASCVETFLLEKIRVVTQEENERGYHVFYQMLRGLDEQAKARYRINRGESFKYISNGYVSVPGTDDAREFSDLVAALDKMGMGDAKEDIFSTLAGILLLGNTEFTGTEISGKANCSVLSEGSADSLADVCDLLGIDGHSFKQSLVLTQKVIANQSIDIPLSVEESLAACRSISKDIYNRLFEYLAFRINQFLNKGKELESYIGILDIFGFEIFQKNSLEQLLINIANEEIHNIYLYVVYEKETALYKSEGIMTGDIAYTTNQDILEMLRGKTSIVSILEDACLAPGKKDDCLVGMYTQRFGNNPRYSENKKSIKDSFIISHTVSDVTYTVSNFISKNKDILSVDFLQLLQGSSNRVVKQMYESVELTKSIGKKHLTTYKYLENLKKICAYLKNTNVFFIKCVKPNETKQKNDFNPRKVFPQLFSLSIIETLNIKFFFQYKYTFESFLGYFKFLDIALASNPSLDDRAKITQMMNSNFDASSFKIGRTMVFMKKEVLHKIREKIEENLKGYKELCNILSATVLRYKKKKLVEENVHKLKVAQAYFRKYRHLKL